MAQNLTSEHSILNGPANGPVVIYSKMDHVLGNTYGLVLDAIYQ